MSLERVSEAFAAAIDMLLRRGHRNIEDALVEEMVGPWRVRVNAPNVPRFDLLIEFNGWPAGIIGPCDGVIAAGEAANEESFIAAMRDAE